MERISKMLKSKVPMFLKSWLYREQEISGLIHCCCATKDDAFWINTFCRDANIMSGRTIKIIK